MSDPETRLKELYRAFVARKLATGHPVHATVHRQNLRRLASLAKRRVTTEPELLDALSNLPRKLQQFGFWWIQVFKTSGTELVLLQILDDDPVARLECAHTLGNVESPRAILKAIQIGTAQLRSPSPDVQWLKAVVPMLKCSSNPEAVDILVTIYERTDLPGWLRGDAGDALGFGSRINDRRTRIFRRAWAAALAGLDESDIEVKFWSMYVIMQLATCYSRACDLKNQCFEPALPLLREIAATDHRLAPGYWWPMAEEAKDAIQAIETGQCGEPDAAERWSGRNG